METKAARLGTVGKLVESGVVDVGSAPNLNMPTPPLPFFLSSLSPHLPPPLTPLAARSAGHSASICYEANMYTQSPSHLSRHAYSIPPIGGSYCLLGRRPKGHSAEGHPAQKVARTQLASRPSPNTNDPVHVSVHVSRDPRDDENFAPVFHLHTASSGTPPHPVCRPASLLTVPPPRPRAMARGAAAPTIHVICH